MTTRQTPPHTTPEPTTVTSSGNASAANGGFANTGTTGDVTVEYHSRPRTRPEELDWAADTLASMVLKESNKLLGDLGDRRPDELAVTWRASDGTTGDRPIDLYRKAAHGRLILIGKSGSGKSVFLYRLVRDLLRDQGESRTAVPVVVNLSAWTPRSGTLTDWIIARLTLGYPFLEERLADALLAEGRILPVLDSFDEINADLRHLAWRGLNNVGTALVVASRPDEYQEAAQSAGPLAAAVFAELEPLSPREAAAYLGRDEDEGAWREALRDDPAGLGRALSSPLMASLARVYGQDLAREQFAGLEGADAIEQHLLARFVPSRYHNEPNGAFSRRGPAWIAALARAMPKGELAWWQLGSSVPPAARIIALGIPAAALGLVTDWLVQGAAAVIALLLVAVFGISVTRTPRPVHLQIGWSGRRRYAVALLGAGLVGGVCVGALGRTLVLSVGVWTLPLAAAAGTLPGSFLTWLIRRWELGNRAKTVWTELRLGAGGSLVGGAVIALVFGYFHVLDSGYLGWILYSCVFGLAFAIPAAVEGESTSDIATPRQLLNANRLWAIVQASIIGVPFALIAGAVLGPARGVFVGAAIGLAWGVGTTAWGRWLVLVRAWMPLCDHLPWRVWSFLEDAHDKQILRQTGAYFQFRHSSLHELLAARGDGRRSSR
ncbi:NACHT domain-containing NTPase [Frankia sp. CiP3]|uniref:NACHT domain-containing protein n=1 Tax=Frankia sp. CiP3 TaxID=2880971 RepID=UPI001EF5DC5A|nr:NACHT domain-containing protein [Frankia sp. CiP3]